MTATPNTAEAALAAVLAYRGAVLKTLRDEAEREWECAHKLRKEQLWEDASNRIAIAVTFEQAALIIECVPVNPPEAKRETNG